MSPRRFDEWRVVPRLMVALYGFMCWRTFEWFTGLVDPSTQQVTFATAIWGAAAAWFGFYVNSGGGGGSTGMNVRGMATGTRNGEEASGQPHLGA